MEHSNLPCHDKFSDSETLNALVSRNRLHWMHEYGLLLLRSLVIASIIYSGIMLTYGIVITSQTGSFSSALSFYMGDPMEVVSAVGRRVVDGNGIETRFAMSIRNNSLEEYEIFDARTGCGCQKPVNLPITIPPLSEREVEFAFRRGIESASGRSIVLLTNCKDMPEVTYTFE